MLFRSAAALVMRTTGALAAVPAGFLIQLLVAGVIGVLAAYGLMTALRVPELAESTARVLGRFGLSPRRR